MNKENLTFTEWICAANPEWYHSYESYQQSDAFDEKFSKEFVFYRQCWEQGIDPTERPRP